MTRRFAYTFKLKTTAVIEQRCAMMAGCCRLVWNKALAMNLHRLEHKQWMLGYQETAFWLTLWKKTEELGFLREAPSQPLQQTLKNLERAFKDGFDKTQSLKRLPRFKRKGQHDSFRYPQGFKFEGRRVYLPKIGWVSYFNARRKIQGTPKNVTVTREADGWYMAVQVEMDVADPVHPSASMVGVDRGIAQLAVLSDGKAYAPVNSYRKLEKKLGAAQRKLRRMKKFSANWKRQQHRIRKVHHKMACVRSDRLHWISHHISKNHAVVVLEDLKVRNMARSAKGTMDNPGTNVRAKSGLNKAILDQGWSMLADRITYKQDWRGGQVIKVPPHHTSQTCPRCRHVSAENRRTQASFRCTQCDYSANADYVGALNIKARGHRVLACGEAGLPDSLAASLHPCRSGTPTSV